MGRSPPTVIVRNSAIGPFLTEGCIWSAGVPPATAVLELLAHEHWSVILHAPETGALRRHSLKHRLVVHHAPETCALRNHGSTYRSFQTSASTGVSRSGCGGNLPYRTN